MPFWGYTTRYVPIILCVGYSVKLSKDQALDMGIRKYFLKPVDGKFLARIVWSLLDDNWKFGSFRSMKPVSLPL